MNDCDTLLIAGSSFPYQEFYPKPGQAKCVQIDVDPARIGLRFPADIGLTGDCKRVLAALLPRLKKHKDHGFLRQAQKAMESWNGLLKERATRSDRPMKPQVVPYHLNKFLSDDAIICSDTGTVTTWGRATFRCGGT